MWDTIITSNIQLKIGFGLVGILLCTLGDECTLIYMFWKQGINNNYTSHFWPVTNAGRFCSFSASFSCVSASFVPFQPVLVVFQPSNVFRPDWWYFSLFILFFVQFADISVGSMLLRTVLTIFRPVQYVFDRFGGFTTNFMVFLIGSLCFAILMVFQPAYECLQSLCVNKSSYVTIGAYMIYKLQLEWGC